MVAFLLPPLEAVHSSFFVNPCVNAPNDGFFCCCLSGGSAQKTGPFSAR
jgi:hypothetical protein